jgi:hypothetical protein
MRTLFYEEEMLKSRRQAVSNEYKSVQPRHAKGSEKARGKNQVQIGLSRLGTFIYHSILHQGDKPELKPIDS